MSVTVQTIPADNLTEFFAPAILNFGLGKTSENRSPELETDESTGRQNGDPFLKPVDTHIETNKENPVLKALFGGKTPQGLTPWTFVTKTSINNCHPFKKTELSHDLTGDDTPAEIPKSLMKNPSRSRRKSQHKGTIAVDSESGVVRNRPDPEYIQHLTPLKEILLNSEPPSAVATCDSVCSIKRRNSALSKLELKNQKVEGASLLNRRRRTSSQVALSVSKPRLSFVNSQRLVQLRTMVDNAVKNHKIYSMTGCYNSVRNALRQRGWIEKIDTDIKTRKRINKFEEIGLYDAAFQFVQKNQTVAAMRLAIQTNCGFAHNDQIRYSGQGEVEIMNRMLRNVTEDLCWLSRPFPYYCYKDFDKFEMINRLPRAYFSNKVGLCNSLQQIQWYYEAGVCSTQFPRTYNTSVKDELQAFKDDFRLTACIGLLKWFVQNYRNGGEKMVWAADGKIELNVIEFALRRCTEFVKTKQHEDIDIMEPQTVWEYQWDNFITQYYRIVNDGQILKSSKDGVSIKTIAGNVQSMLNIIKPHWPQYDIEGYQNYWIVKPGGRCCGAGIVIKNHLDQILLIVNPCSLKETRYVVQKYIERPLLIYNTKFDIRQWFLVTNVYPLTVWMYRESYLRFCSQPFTLNNTHESIHLCNNAVQKKYKNGKRDRGLPDENMWDCYTFQTYLKAIGYPDAWEKYIYPGMKESFIGALLASQDSMERKKNCFELYGADFMISDTLTDGPWLIEINSNPAMDSSTSVTARMCPQVLEDIIKVVIDRRDNKSASTGAFEMVYRQNCPPIPPYLGMSLCIKGKKAYRPNGDPRSDSRKSKGKSSSESLLYTCTKERSVVGGEIGSPKIAWEATEKENESSMSASSVEEHSTRAQLADMLHIVKLAETKQTGSKRLKIDWVRKNIEDLKRLHQIKQTKTSLIEESSSTSSLMATSCREELFRLLRDPKVRHIVREIMRTKNSMRGAENMCVQGIEPSQLDSLIAIEDLTESSTRNLLRFLQSYQQKEESPDGVSKSFIEELKEASFRTYSNPSPRSCPAFGAQDREKRKTETFAAGVARFVSGTKYHQPVENVRSCRSSIIETRRRLRGYLGKAMGISRRIKGDGKKRNRLQGGQAWQKDEGEGQRANATDSASTQKLGLRGRSFKCKHRPRGGKQKISFIDNTK
ncbi:hypothetical protein RUM44_003616 [Polyplax serrata]|uniref:Tubulin glycylase 3A n=1 Tax=Polyplax serrata TaxID=468196 RepID=A0ABR1AH46_POLSC